MKPTADRRARRDLSLYTIREVDCTQPWVGPISDVDTSFLRATYRFETEKWYRLRAWYKSLSEE